MSVDSTRIRTLIQAHESCDGDFYAASAVRSLTVERGPYCTGSAPDRNVYYVRLGVVGTSEAVKVARFFGGNVIYIDAPADQKAATGRENELALYLARRTRDILARHIALDQPHVLGLIVVENCIDDAREAALKLWTPPQIMYACYGDRKYLSPCSCLTAESEDADA